MILKKLYKKNIIFFAGLILGALFLYSDSALAKVKMAKISWDQTKKKTRNSWPNSHSVTDTVKHTYSAGSKPSIIF